jgi:hypothetical protein
MKLLDKEGKPVSNQETKTKALGKALTALAMHSHLVAKKIDDNLMPIHQSEMEGQLTKLKEAIDDEPGVTLFIGFGLYMAMNPPEVTGIAEELTGEAFNRYMKVLNSIEQGG